MAADDDTILTTLLKEVLELKEAINQWQREHELIDRRFHDLSEIVQGTSRAIRRAAQTR
jgi:hypothetical protein